MIQQEETKNVCPYYFMNERPGGTFWILSSLLMANRLFAQSLRLIFICVCVCVCLCKQNGRPKCKRNLNFLFLSVCDQEQLETFRHRPTSSCCCCYFSLIRLHLFWVGSLLLGEAENEDRLAKEGWVRGYNTPTTGRTHTLLAFSRWPNYYLLLLLLLGFRLVVVVVVARETPVVI